MRSFRARYALILAFAFDAGAAPLPYVIISNGLAPPNPANLINAANSLPNNSLWVVAAECDPYVVGCDTGGPRTQVSIETGGVIGGDLRIDDGMEGNIYSHGSHVTVNGGSILGDVFNSAGDFDITGGEIVGTARIDFAAIMTMTGGSVGGVQTIHSGLTMTGGTVLGSVEGDGFFTLLGGSIVGDLKVNFANTHTEWHGGTVGGTLMIGDALETTIFGTGFAIDGVPVPYGQTPILTGLLTGTLENGDALHTQLFRYQDYQDSRLIFAPPVPEPGTAALLGVGLGVIAAARRRAARRRR